MNTKAQVRMWETIAILVIFFFLLIGGITFFTRLQQAGAKEEQKYFGQLDAIEITKVIQNLPELECPSTLQVSNCLDELKIVAMGGDIGITGILQNPSADIEKHYVDLFGYSNVIIEKIVPVYKKWEIYDKKREVGDESMSSANIPISVYDPKENKFGFGVLTVNVYK